MKCPKCRNNNCEELIEEVDVGVGILKHRFGLECPVCGQCGVCPECGTPDWFVCPKGCPSRLED